MRPRVIDLNIEGGVDLDTLYIGDVIAREGREELVIDGRHHPNGTLKTISRNGCLEEARYSYFRASRLNPEFMKEEGRIKIDESDEKHSMYDKMLGEAGL